MKICIQRDGLTLRGEIVKPDNIKKCPIVILMHGFKGNRGYDESSNLFLLASLLKKSEIASIRFDFNGHGESDGLFENMTVHNELSDGKAILDYVKTLDYVSDIFILGHSQGGVIASMLSGYYHENFKGVILTAPAATLVDDAIKGECQGVSYDPNNIPDYLEINNGKYKVGGMYFRIAQTLEIYKIASQYTGPVCLIHGDNDTVVDKISSTRYHECYKNSELHIINGESHSLNGRYRENILNIILEFIKKHCEK